MATGGGDTIREWSSDFVENLAEQNDEVLALQSIYEGEGTRISKLNEPPEDVIENPDSDKRSLHTLQLNVPFKHETDTFQVDVCLPDDVSETTEPDDQKEEKKLGINFKRSISGHRLMGSFNVKHLTPIKLLVVLPPEYPLNGPPLYTLSCMWLSQLQLSTLCEVLDKLWMDSSSLPVLFTWIDWLENNALSHLGIHNQILLSQSDESDVDDRRAYNECYALEEGINSMLLHDKEEDMVEFQNSDQECHVCYLTRPGNEFYRIEPCNHHFCRDCISDFCKHHVKEGTVLDLICPECEVDIPPYIIQSLLDNEEWLRYESLSLQKGLDRMGDIVWCPRCQQPVIREQEETLNMAHCTTCFYTFCTKCIGPWHRGLPCDDDEDETEEEAGKKPEKTHKDINSKLKMMMRKREERMSRKLVLSIAKQCPKCKIDIQKDGGCNKVTCAYCHASMCWICGKDITAESYSHFSSNTICQTFTLETARQPAMIPVFRPRPQAVLELEYRLAADPDARKNLGHCPACKARNLRTYNNNHIKCWNCHRNTCFQCKKVITDTPVTKHFQAPNTCKQHSTG